MAIKLEEGGGLGLNGQAIKRRTLFAASLMLIIKIRLRARLSGLLVEPSFLLFCHSYMFLFMHLRVLALFRF